MKEFWERFFLFLERTLPGLLVAFGIGQKVGSQGKEKLESQLREKDLELEKRNNDDLIDKYISNKSDDDIIRDAIAEGEELLRGKRD